MTTLLSVSIAVLLPALVGALLLALLAATVLLLLLALLALDVLLERNGVDRRAGTRRAWERLRRPAPSPGRAAGDAAPAPRGAEHDDAAPRVPFSARRPGRAPSAPEPVDRRATEPGSSGTGASAVTVDPPTPAPEAAPAASAPTVSPETGSPTPAADAVTEVLAVEVPPAARARATRDPRVTPARAPKSAPTPTPEQPADRDSAIDRLFAPLLETDRTEPLPAPRTARPARKPRDEA